MPHNGTAWGSGGALVGKALPCDAIPSMFKYQKPFAQDTSPVPASETPGMTYHDKGLQYWSHTPGWPMPAKPALGGNYKKVRIRMRLPAVDVVEARAVLLLEL